MARGRSRYYRHSIMNNTGFGPVKIVQEGEKRLDSIGLNNMTIAEALKSYKKGLAITTA